MDFVSEEKEIDTQIRSLEDEELITFSRTIQGLIEDDKHRYYIPLLATLLRDCYYETFTYFDEISIQNLVYLARNIVNRTLNVRVHWQRVIQTICNHNHLTSFLSVHDTNALYDYFTTKLLKNMCKYFPFENREHVSTIVFRIFVTYKRNEYLTNVDLHEIALFFYFHQEIKKNFPPSICENKTVLRKICVFLGVPSPQINEIIDKILITPFSHSKAFALQDFYVNKY